MSINTKTQTYKTRADAFKSFTNAALLAKDRCKARNEEDPTLNETVDMTTDETNKRFTLTRPDTQEGVMIVHYVWEE